MGGVSRTPGSLWGSLLPLVAVMSIGAAVPVVYSECMLCWGWKELTWGDCFFSGVEV